MKKLILILVFILGIVFPVWAKHPIGSAKFNSGNETIHVVMNDGTVMDVPDDLDNRFRKKLADWEAGGNIIQPVDPYATTLAEAKRFKAKEAKRQAAELLKAYKWSDINITQAQVNSYKVLLKTDWIMAQRPINALTTVKEIRAYKINWTIAP